MADCMSLPNAAELVERLRFSRPKHGEEICIDQQAADAIEALLTENAKLKAERDAAVEDLDFGRCCTTCLHRKTRSCPPNKCLDDDNLYWEWRGVTDTNVGSKKEEEDAAD